MKKRKLTYYPSFNQGDLVKSAGTWPSQDAEFGPTAAGSHFTHMVVEDEVGMIVDGPWKPEHETIQDDLARDYKVLFGGKICVFANYNLKPFKRRKSSKKVKRDV